MSEIIFVIGKPGSGKSTAVAALKEAFESHDHDLSVSVIDEFRILETMLDKLSEEQAQVNDDKSFSILDRTVFSQTFEKLLEQLNQQVTQHDVVICEFSRNQYWPLFETIMNRVTSDFSVLYVSSTLETCEARNKVRKQQLPIPDGIIGRYYARDDLTDVQNKLRGKLMLLRNNRDGEARLQTAVTRLFDNHSFVANGISGVNRFKPTLKQELMVGFMLLGYLAISLLGMWHLSYDFRGTAVYPQSLFGLAGFTGILGSTLYCMRSFYAYYIDDNFDYQRFKWWYFFRPITGFVVAMALVAMVMSQMMSVSGIAMDDPSRTLLTVVSLSFLAGFTTEQVVERIRKASKALFGEEGDKGKKPG